MRIFAVITHTVFVLTAISILIARFSKFSWIADLFSHFVLQYLIILIICFLAYSYLRAYFLSSAALVMILICFSQIYPYVHVKSAHSVTNENVRVMFYNMWVGNTNYIDIGKMIEKEDPDVIIFEEVAGVSYRELQDVLADKYPYSDFKKGPFDYFDIAYFSRTEPTNMQVHYLSGEKLPILDLTFPLFHILGVHTRAPMSADKERVRNEYLVALADLIKKIDAPVIIGGDFNISPWSPYWKEFVADSRLVEGRAGNGLLPSWPSWLPAFMRIPIDQVVVSSEIKVVGLHTGGSSHSDHLPIIADLSL